MSIGPHQLTEQANMQSTQEIAELMLDSGRNALLALDIKVSIATLGVGTGALVAGFFGMNVCPPFAPFI
jgi:magnesium transporter